jgi:hypothetical protein
MIVAIQLLAVFVGLTLMYYFGIDHYKKWIGIK